MQTVTTICDKCGDKIKDIPITLFAQFNGGMGHNEIPPSGWHFHYHCFAQLMSVVTGLLADATSNTRKGGGR